MRVKLIDFGVATEFPRGTKSFELGKVVGTAAYLAPECWTGTYGTGSDMWALGVLACYLLFSEPPTGTAENCSSMSERRVAERIDAL